MLLPRIGAALRPPAEIAGAFAETVRLFIVRLSPSRRVLAAALVLVVLGAGCLGTTITGDEPGRSARSLTPVPRGGDYQFAVDFSGQQGNDTWSYLQWNGTVYTPMTWNAADDRWHGDCPSCLIGRSMLHPGTSDAVIAWTAPRAGTVTVRGTIEHETPGSTGDGVRAFVRRRSGASLTKVWPSAEAQDVRPGFMANHVFTTTVEVDDVLLFHVNAGADNNGDSTAWNPRVTYDYSPQFTLDQAELVMRPEDFRRVGIGTSMDSSLSVVPNGTNLDFYHSGSGIDIQKFRGTLDQPAQNSVYAGSGHFTNPNQVGGKWWIENIYQTPGGPLLAFCHIEEADPATTGWWAGGLAYSTDGGNTFAILGTTIAAAAREPDGTRNNISGMPYVVKDGYFYVYYTESGLPAVARAPMAEVLDAASRGTVSPWSKYHDNGWASNGLNGPATAIVTASAINDYGTHGDAAYSTYLNRYLLTGGSHGSGRGVYLTFGDDPASYDVPSWIQSGRTSAPTLSPYETIVNADGTDNGVVGQTFYVYFGYFFDWSLPVGKGQPTTRQWVYRQKVTLHLEGFEQGIHVGNAEYSRKQGERGWRYLEYDGTIYTDLRWDDVSLHWQGVHRNTQISSNSLHPDGGRDTVRAWTAPRDGTVEIGTLGGISVADGPGADGVQVKIVNRGDAVWPASGYQPLPPGRTYPMPRVQVQVKRGDLVAFHVNAKDNNDFDTTTWVPTVRYLRTGG